MNYDFLPSNIFNAINFLNIKDICEIRMRKGFPIKILKMDKQEYLQDNKFNKIICSNEDIITVLENVTENSLYAFNDRINQGFITTSEGIRIGILGECVFSEGKIIAVKNFNSLNIRIPREVLGCGQAVYKHVLFKDKILNTLVISSAGYGKTTILKDLIRKIDKDYNKNILVIDERGEFKDIKGENIDTILYSTKGYAFDIAIRSMSPEIVVTDELCGSDDWEYVYKALNSGVTVISSCHARSLKELMNKRGFNKEIFDRYVVLKSHSKPGCIESVFNKEFIKLT